MNIKEIREIMGLTIPQVADELNVPRQDIIDSEENGETYLFSRFTSVFPVNPEVLTNPQANLFLDSYDRGTPGSRMQRWREENGISLSEMAQAIGMTEEQLAKLEGGKDPVARSLGEKTERNTGMNRKWLMYGDGREKGTPKLRIARAGNNETGKRTEKEGSSAPNRDGGQRIKTARKAADMSREKLAELAGLSVSRIIQIESGYVKEEKVKQLIQLISAPGGTDEKRKSAGQRIRDARKAAGLSVKEAAALAGLAHTSLAHMESGYVTEKRAEELADIFLNQSAGEAFSGKAAGIRIRDARKAAGLSQKELATILRVPPGTVSAIELGDVTEERAESILRRIAGEGRRPQATVKRIKKKDNVLLGANIRDTRAEIGLSQKEMGDLLGFSQGKISLIERGKVDEATAKEILRVLEEESKKHTKQKSEKKQAENPI